MKRPIIYPYKMSSEGAIKLKKAFNTIMVYPDRNYRYKPNDLIINWGSGIIPAWWSEEAQANCLNTPGAVMNSVNKKRTFQLLSQAGVTIPAPTTDFNVAKRWVNGGDIIFCRGRVEGMDGDGIVVARSEEELIPCSLYTKYVNNRDEFRIHVFKGQVIAAFQKLKRNGIEHTLDPLVKAGNAYIHCQIQVRLPHIIYEEAIKATEALGLDFAGVDVGMNYYRNKAYVFETNTACGGMGPITTQAYIRKIQTELERS